MKSRTTNCIECRKQVYKEAEEAYLKHEYAFSRTVLGASPCSQSAECLPQ